MALNQNRSARLPPEVNRIVYVKNLPFKITPAELYDIFGKYGPIRQIRLGTRADTKGRAYVVYEDIYDAKNAVDHLSGFNVRDRYIIVLYHKHESLDHRKQQMNLAQRQAQLEKVKKQYGVTETPQT